MREIIKKIIFIIVGTALCLGIMYAWIAYNNSHMSESEKAAYIDGYHAGIKAYAAQLEYTDDLRGDISKLAKDGVIAFKDDPKHAEDYIPDYITDGMDQYVQDYIKWAAEEAESECLENE